MGGGRRDRRPRGGVVGVAERDARAAQEVQRQDDPGDQAEDPVGLHPVRADESLRPLEHADPYGDRDPDEHEPREHVLAQSEPARVTDQREREVGGDRLPERLDDRRQQDQEAPEDERMHDAGEGPLEELPLPQDLTGLARHAAAHVAATVDRSSQADQAREQPSAPGEQARGDRQHEQQQRRLERPSGGVYPQPRRSGMPPALPKLLIPYTGSILR